MPERPRSDKLRPYYATADELRAIDEGLAGPAVSAEKVRELFRRLAQEPRNEPIRDKIIEIARKLGD